MDVSVILVNYNVGTLIIQTLESLLASTDPQLDIEVFVVDNGSNDNSVSVIRQRFPFVKIIANVSNVGFARANNQVISLSLGRYILLLNPDTVLKEAAVDRIVNFMDTRPEVGICGPKVVLPDGRLDQACRRTFKTPSTYLYHGLGLNRVFTRSPTFGRYYLSYLDPDILTEVDSVIGAFLMIRREVVNRIGLLDERFFMYCEDEDWCFRAKQAGWKVVYNPEAEIIHYKGSSSRTRKMAMIWEWHKSVYIFHRKNLATNYSPLSNLMVYILISLSLVASLIRNNILSTSKY
jgi:GT2 family glycosyltransferase